MISGNFIITFAVSQFSHGCCGHHSVKGHVWEKIMDQKVIDQLDCMIFANIVSL